MRDMDDLLRQIQVELDLDREIEQEILAEIRTHLDESVTEAIEAGSSWDDALAQATTRFGLGQEVGRALQETHVGRGTAEAVVAAGLPVLLALVLRWLLFAPDGAEIGWQQVHFWIVAMAVLLIPLLKFHRWRYASVSWGFFWLVTVLSVLLPTLRW